MAALERKLESLRLTHEDKVAELQRQVTKIDRMVSDKETEMHSLQGQIDQLEGSVLERKMIHEIQVSSRHTPPEQHTLAPKIRNKSATSPQQVRKGDVVGSSVGVRSYRRRARLCASFHFPRRGRGGAKCARCDRPPPSHLCMSACGVRSRRTPTRRERNYLVSRRCT